MKAIYLIKNGKSSQAFEMRETDMPDPAPTEIRIKVVSSGLNFADVLARRGLYPDAPPIPALLGYDVAGYIDALGKDVKGFETGQRVTALTRFGGYAEYAVSMQEGVSVIPDDLDFDEATALATQGCTAYFCAEESIRLHKEDKVLVQAAAGGVGSMLVQLAKNRGCQVYGTASSSKLEYLKNLGVDVPIDYRNDDFYQIVRHHSADGIDVVFDSLGGMAFKKGMKLLAPGGKMVSYGAAAQMRGNETSKIRALGVALNFGLFSPISLLMNSKSLITVNMLRIADHRPHIFKEVLDAVVEYANKGVIHPKVSQVFSADEMSKAHDYLESRKSIGKVTINWQK